MPRQRASWMNEKDDILLEYLRSIHPSAEPPKVIHWNVDNRGDELRLGTRAGDMWSTGTTRNRLDDLEDLGLVDVVGRGSYRIITDAGMEYLDGDLDAGSLQQDE